MPVKNSLHVLFMILFVLLSSALGCGEDDQGADRCSSNDDCASGELCNAIVGICVAQQSRPDEAYSAQGTFECPLADPLMQTVPLGRANVVARVNNDPVDYTVSVECTVDTTRAGDPSIHVVFLSPNDRAGIRSTLDLEILSADLNTSLSATTPTLDPTSGTASVVMFVTSDSFEAGSSPLPGNYRFAAAGQSGTLRISGDATVGTTLRGELTSVVLAPTCFYTNDGECDEPSLCPVGTDIADCANAMCTDVGLACTQSEQCCGFDTNQARCVNYGDELGVLCGAVCNTGADCQSSCCLPVGDTGVNACAPPSFCESSCIDVGQTCQTTGDCCGDNTICVDFGAGSRTCATTCGDASDCTTQCCAPLQGIATSVCAPSSVCQ